MLSDFEKVLDFKRCAVSNHEMYKVKLERAMSCLQCTCVDEKWDSEFKIKTLVEVSRSFLNRQRREYCWHIKV